MSIVLLTLEQAEAIAVRAVEIALSKKSTTTPELKPEQHYLSAKEVKEKYKVSLPTLWKHRNDGSIPYYRFGKKILFLEHEIESSFKKFQLKGKKGAII